MSVGGGSIKKKVSLNIVEAIKFAKKKKSKILGIVGCMGGYTEKKADYFVKVPMIDAKLITPYTESFQAVIWHSLVSHPLLQENRTKW
jgi:D-sedoheptulose 7-phosphate isomerase